MVVENRPGAGGIIAERGFGAGSPPDGYTLIVVATGHALNGHFYAEFRVDPFKDFTADFADRLVAQHAARPRRFAVQVGRRRDRGGARATGHLTYGHAGNGTSPHLAGELFKSMAKIEITAVAYKGGAPVLGRSHRRSHCAVVQQYSEIDGTDRGRNTVRALGVTTASITPRLPNVPTIAEAALPGYDTGVWWGFLAPAGLPADMGAARLAEDCAEGVVSNFRRCGRSCLQLGATPIGSSPEVSRRLHPRRIREVGPDHQSGWHSRGMMRGSYPAAGRNLL